MKALVMGGTEFVSSSMAKYLILKGYEVDIFTRGIKNVAYGGIRKHLVGDRKRLDDMKSILRDEEYDYIFDMTAYTQEDVQVLTSVINRSKLKRYVFCSSGAVYTDSNNVINEEFKRGENSNWGKYGLDKKKAEDYLFELYYKEKLPVTIFRPTYIYGESNNLYRECYFFDRVTKDLGIPIPSGDNRTQYIYIDDLVKAFESALHVQESIGQAYNLTHPQTVTWQQFIDIIFEITNKKVNIVKVDCDKLNVVSREMFPFRDVTYLLDVQKAKKHRLYLPQIDFKAGMQMTYEWYCLVKPKLQDLRMNKIEWCLRNLNY